MQEQFTSYHFPFQSQILSQYQTQYQTQYQYQTQPKFNTQTLSAFLEQSLSQFPNKLTDALLHGSSLTKKLQDQCESFRESNEQMKFIAGKYNPKINKAKEFISKIEKRIEKFHPIINKLSNEVQKQFRTISNQSHYDISIIEGKNENYDDIYRIFVECEEMLNESYFPKRNGLIQNMDNVKNECKEFRGFFVNELSKIKEDIEELIFEKNNQDDDESRNKIVDIMDQIYQLRNQLVFWKNENKEDNKEKEMDIDIEQKENDAILRDNREFIENEDDNREIKGNYTKGINAFFHGRQKKKRNKKLNELFY